MKNFSLFLNRSFLSSLLVVALKRLLPVGLNLFAGKEQELVQHCKDKFLSSCEEEVLRCVPVNCFTVPIQDRFLTDPVQDILEFCKNQITLPNKYDPSDELCWQHHLYSTLGSKQCVSAADMKPEELEQLVTRIVSMGKVNSSIHLQCISYTLYAGSVWPSHNRPSLHCWRQGF